MHLPRRLRLAFLLVVLLLPLLFFSTPNQEPGRAQEASSSELKPGTYVLNIDEDGRQVFEVALRQNEWYRFLIDVPDDADYDLYLYDPAASQVDFFDRGVGAVDGFLYHALDSGTHTLVVSHVSGSGGEYVLSFTPWGEQPIGLSWVYRNVPLETLERGPMVVLSNQKNITIYYYYSNSDLRESFESFAVAAIEEVVEIFGELNKDVALLVSLDPDPDAYPSADDVAGTCGSGAGGPDPANPNLLRGFVGLGCVTKSFFVHEFGHALVAFAKLNYVATSEGKDPSYFTATLKTTDLSQYFLREGIPSALAHLITGSGGTSWPEDSLGYPLPRPYDYKDIWLILYTANPQIFEELQKWTSLQKTISPNDIVFRLMNVTEGLHHQGSPLPELVWLSLGQIVINVRFIGWKPDWLVPMPYIAYKQTDPTRYDRYRFLVGDGRLTLVLTGIKAQHRVFVPHLIPMGDDTRVWVSLDGSEAKGNVSSRANVTVPYIEPFIRFDANGSADIVIGPPTTEYKTVIDQSPPFSQMIVDNVSYSTNELPLSFWWRNASTHAISVSDTEIDLGNRTRYAFKLWSDDVSSADRTLKVTSPLGLTSLWSKQYYLRPISEYGNPQGEGWYDEGSTATFSVMSPLGFLIQEVFAGWSGDSSSTSPTATVVMDSQKLVTATWRTDYTQLLLVIGVVAAVAAIGALLVRSRRKPTRGPVQP